MRRGRRLLIVNLLFLLLVTACAQQTEAPASLPDGALYLYYPDREKTTMTAVVYEPQADRSDAEAVVEEVAAALQTSPREKEHVAPISEDVVLREYHLEDGLLTLDFDVRYLDQDPATEVLTRAAIVLSFTGIDGVDHVMFLVSGTALMKNDTDPVGVMNADSFVWSDLP